MSHSSNPNIQQLMDQAASLDSNSEDIEQKLQLIAEAVAMEQRRANVTSEESNFAPQDPQDAFACEGCQ